MARSTYDLAIVGGGPAGISTAMHVLSEAPALAERMIVLERAHYPRDKYCAGAVGARAIARLEAIGVRLAPAMVPRVDIHAFSFAAQGQRRLVRQPHVAWVVRRTELDHAVARAAMDRGLLVKQGAKVTGVEVEADGARVHLEGDDPILARAVVGADGVTGPVRRSVGLSRGRLRAQAIEVDTDPAPGDPPRDALHFDFEANSLHGYAWDFPTLLSGQPKVCRGVYRVVRPGETDDVRERLRLYLASKGIGIDGLVVKQLAERGFEPEQAVSRPRVLLVGEAAGIDIATGEGIAQAIEYGALAGTYLARAFRSGDLSFADWLTCIRGDAVGLQLAARTWADGRFFGPDRAAMERTILRSPAALRLAMRNFAGAPNGARSWVDAIGELVPALLAEDPKLLLRTARSAKSAWSGARALPGGILRGRSGS